MRDSKILQAANCIEHHKKKNNAAAQGHPRGGGGVKDDPIQPHKRNCKSTVSYDTMVSKVWRDLNFSRNQLLKSGDAQDIRMFKNKIKTWIS
jgi:hypothetical protein